MNPAIPSGCVSYAEATTRLQIAVEMVQTWNPDWTAIYQQIQQFEHVERFDEVATNVSEAMMSVLLALIGDCHREMRQFAKAAGAYSRSVRHRPFGGCALYYADMVITHHLTGHYATALHALEASEETWRRTPVWQRVPGYIAGLWMCWRCGKLWFPLWGREEELTKTLRTLVDTK